MEGRMIQETVTLPGGNELVHIAVPLSGKQGVYGVLYLSLDGQWLEDLDFQLITILADTAGTAFENAKLYEQSNMLISELRLINELTKQLNQSLRLSEIFNFALKELLHIFKADFCSTLQLDADKNLFKVMSSNVDAMSKELYSTDYGFTGLVYATKEPLILVDYSAFSKVKSVFMDETQSRSLMVVPLVVNSEVNGAIMLSHRDPNYFSYDNFKLLQVLSTHIGLAIANASLHAKVQRMANHDNLTGLYARHYLDDRVNQKQKIDFCGSLIVVDIDHFKQINDTYGHQIGDQILRQVCEVIRTSIRETDIAARWGGEELAIYFPQLTKSQTLRVAERIRSRVEIETNPGVTVSCGISEWNWDDDKISVESLFYKADMALYQAKNAGRNQIQVG
jgi:diguanylate cyclase (GGDEF)-like protein